MKIEKLKLENFKAFHSNEFQFKKITLLAGANSAGKSTILNALASILQGSESRPFPFYFSNYGKNVHLGGFKDIVSNGITSSKFKIGITFKFDNREVFSEGSYRYATNGQQILVDSVKLKFNGSEFAVKWGGQTNGYSAMKKVSLQNQELEKKLAGMITSSISEVLMRLNENKTVDDNALNSHIKDMTNFVDDWESVELKQSKDLFTSLNERLAYKLILGSYKNLLVKLLNNTSYIGPIRPYPSRHYFLSSHQDKMDALGANAFQLLIDWYKSDNKKFKKITADLKYLKLAENLNPESIKDELIELRIQPFGQKQSVNFSDVGFGLSQIIPVLVANTATEKDGTVLVNQPEVHLHPSSQAMLANYFVDESKNKNFIIETHSEYLINRFRLLVAKGKLQKKDISIIYIDNGDNGPIISNIDISETGSLINAPKSFFDTYYVDSSELIFSSISDEDDEI